jgi:hypothetical protein
MAAACFSKMARWALERKVKLLPRPHRPPVLRLLRLGRRKGRAEESLEIRAGFSRPVRARGYIFWATQGLRFAASLGLVLWARWAGMGGRVGRQGRDGLLSNSFASCSVSTSWKPMAAACFSKMARWALERKVKLLPRPHRPPVLRLLRLGRRKGRAEESLEIRAGFSRPVRARGYIFWATQGLRFAASLGLVLWARWAGMGGRVGRQGRDGLLSNSFASCSVSTSWKPMAAACFSKMARWALERKVKLLPRPHRPPVLRLLRLGRRKGRAEESLEIRAGFSRPVRARGYIFWATQGLRFAASLGLVLWARWAGMGGRVGRQGRDGLLSNSFASCSVSTSWKPMAAACFSKMARWALERKVKLLPRPHRPPVLRLLRLGRRKGRAEESLEIRAGFSRPVRARGYIFWATQGLRFAASLGLVLWARWAGMGGRVGRQGRDGLLSNSFASCSVSTSWKPMAAACFSKMARWALERKVKLLPRPHRPPVLRLLRLGRRKGRAEESLEIRAGFSRPVRARGYIFWATQGLRFAASLGLVLWARWAGMGGRVGRQGRDGLLSNSFASCSVSTSWKPMAAACFSKMARWALERKVKLLPRPHRPPVLRLLRLGRRKGRAEESLEIRAGFSRPVRARGYIFWATQGLRFAASLGLVLWARWAGMGGRVGRQGRDGLLSNSFASCSVSTSWKPMAAAFFSKMARWAPGRKVKLLPPPHRPPVLRLLRWLPLGRGGFCIGVTGGTPVPLCLLVRRQGRDGLATVAAAGERWILALRVTGRMPVPLWSFCGDEAGTALC